MTTIPYDLISDPRPNLGLIVLQADETIEDDFRRIFHPDDVRLHITRIPSGDEVTPETLRAMEAALPAAACLLPKGLNFAAVAYACTSGTALIGADKIKALTQNACQTQAVTNPLTATFAALHTLNLARIGIISPYTDAIANDLRGLFEGHGFSVPATLSFGEDVEANVARIAPESIAAAAVDLAQSAEVDGIFLSCTNLRTLSILDPLEAELGLPVLSSNQTLAWHLAQFAGMTPTPFGRLMARHI